MRGIVGTGPLTRRGFTLTELLIDIVVIAVLISMILPALGKSRQSAKAAMGPRRAVPADTGLRGPASVDVLPIKRGGIQMGYR